MGRDECCREMSNSRCPPSHSCMRDTGNIITHDMTGTRSFLLIVCPPSLCYVLTLESSLSLYLIPGLIFPSMSESAVRFPWLGGKRLSSFSLLYFIVFSLFNQPDFEMQFPSSRVLTEWFSFLSNPLSCFLILIPRPDSCWMYPAKYAVITLRAKHYGIFACERVSIFLPVLLSLSLSSQEQVL